ncbi:ERMES complex subunit [Ceratobasidium sp. 392]|nr:ERMES complex subunit [Ceratobasidium sp. 392]
MSFQFEWPRFSESFHRDACQMLDAALNKGNKPAIIADKIEVVELEMGKQPPELEVRDIGDLTTDQFRGIFRLSYAGDAHIVLRTKVQANPLNNKKSDLDGVLGTSRGILAAHQPLVVPMLLRLSHFRLNAYVVLVVSKQKGITLVFKTDPLQNVDVSSTFDSIAVIQKYIQREIEGQLREMFREDLPGIIHRLSQRWLAGKAKVETPYAQKPRVPLPSLPSVAEHEPISPPTINFPPLSPDRPLRFPTPSPLASPYQSESGRGRKPASTAPLLSVPSPLRQWVGHQEALRRQMGRAMPLGSDDASSIAFPSRAPLSRVGSQLRYEQEDMRSVRHRRASSQLGSSVPTGSRSSGAARTISTPPSSELPPVDEDARPGEPRNRRRSLSPSMVSPTYPREVMYYDTPENSIAELEREIVLRPGLNTTVTQLSTLSQTNHTLSLYTPSVKHVTVRSVPRRPPGSGASVQHAERQPVKARRKRTYRLGKSSEPQEPSPTSSQSEYDYYRRPDLPRIRTDDDPF